MSCKFCEKGGIPIMPTRLALSYQTSAIPEAKAPFVDKAPKAGQAKVKYIQRALRSGYLYVYDEARNQWKGYLITEEGYYYQFEVDMPTPDISCVAFSCSRSPDDVALASCITIPNTKEKPATNVWLAFSDIEWTKHTLEQHKKAEYRIKNMRKVDIAAWIASKKQAYCGKLELADTLVAEYVLDNNAAAKKEFEWSPFAFNSKKTKEGYFKTVTEGAKNKAEKAKAEGRTLPSLQSQHGLIVRIKDPTAVVRESTRFMQYQSDVFLSDDKRIREHTVSRSIDALKANVENAAVQKAKDDAPGQRNAAASRAGVAIFNPKVSAEIDAIAVIDAKEEEDIRKNAWAEYQTKFNEQKKIDFDNKFKAELKAFEEQWITPLANFHKEWMQYTGTIDYFEYNFDDTNIVNGFSYQAVAALCFENMADKAAFNELCQAWFHGNVEDKRNIGLRSMVANNKIVAKKIQEATNSPFDWRTPGWENVFGAIKTAFDEAEKALEKPQHYLDWLSGKGIAIYTTRLMFEVSGPIIRLLNNTLSPNLVSAPLVAKQALLAIGAINNSPIYVVGVSGTKKEFVKALATRLMQASNHNGRPIGITTIEKAVKKMVAELEASGVDLKTGVNQSWLLAIDEHALGQVSEELGQPRPIRTAKLKTLEKAQALATSIRTADQLHNVGSGLQKTVSSNVRLGVVNLILQGVSMTKAFEDDKKSMSFQATENHRKLQAMGGAIIGTFLEVTSKELKELPALTSRVTLGIKWAKWTKAGLSVIEFFGKLLGAAAGIISAAFDGIHAIEEWKHGNTGLAILYGGSAALGVMAALVALGAITGGLAWLVLGLLVAVTIIIELVKNNAMQDWLERCLWGTKGDKYKGKGNLLNIIEAEQTDLNQALAS